MRPLALSRLSPILALLSLALPLSAQDSAAPVRGLFAAFNEHDPEAMAEFVAADVQVFHVDEDGMQELGTRGRAELVDQMRGYFRSQPNVRSEIEGLIAGPVYVSVRERIVGGAASLSVYEVRDDLIRRVWYFPVDDAPGPPDWHPTPRG